jgi:SAM-dependent methyltransferase
MPSYDFDKARDEWSKPPFTGYGYFSTQELLDNGDDDKIREMMDLACRARYEGVGHKEWNEWMDYPSAKGKVVLDYGCGTGCEALQYAKHGALVYLADIAPANVAFAKHVMELYGYGDLVHGTEVIQSEHPFVVGTGHQFDVDIFHSCGVLCATPQIGEVMARAHELVVPGGEARLMLYSEHSWHGDNVDPFMDVAKEPPPVFEEFVRRMDTVGLYADWHSKERLQWRLDGDPEGIWGMDTTTHDGWAAERALAQEAQRVWDIEFHGIMTEIPDFCISRLRRRK